MSPAGAPSGERAQARRNEDGTTLAQRHGLEPAPRFEKLWTPSYAAGLKLHLWLLVTILAALFFLGFTIGNLGSIRTRIITTLSPASHAMNTIGLGKGSYLCSVASSPDGAGIRVDGKSLGVVTPIEVELAPGEHQITLNLADQGIATYTVQGSARDHVKLTPELTGSITVSSHPSSVPMAVSVDGVAYGRAPVKVDHLAPGPHDVRVDGAGLVSVDRTVNVKINETTDMAVRSVMPPATGVINVSAATDDDGGLEPLRGARVWVDGELRGRTPLKLVLAYGPHSIRAEYSGQVAPTQVIYLPGGNERFAEFTFGSSIDPTRLTVQPAGRGAARVAVSLSGVRAHDLVGVWLHTPGQDGVWERREVPVQPTPDGVTGVIAITGDGRGSSSRMPFYFSALKVTGEEYFTELQNARVRGGRF